MPPNSSYVYGMVKTYLSLCSIHIVQTTRRCSEGILPSPLSVRMQCHTLSCLECRGVSPQTQSQLINQEKKARSRRVCYKNFLISFISQHLQCPPRLTRPSVGSELKMLLRTNSKLSEMHERINLVYRIIRYKNRSINRSMCIAFGHFYLTNFTVDFRSRMRVMSMMLLKNKTIS
jgi:hypothetical protein